MKMKHHLFDYFHHSGHCYAYTKNRVRFSINCKSNPVFQLSQSFFQSLEIILFYIQHQFLDSWCKNQQQDSKDNRNDADNAEVHDFRFVRI